MLRSLEKLLWSSSVTATEHAPPSKSVVPNPVITDLTICCTPPSASDLDPSKWHLIEKNLCLSTPNQHAWLYVALANEEELVAEDLVVTKITIGQPPPSTGQDLGCSWRSRPCGIWIRRSNFSGKVDEAVTELEILFGVDAVDPRPRWTLIRAPLQIDSRSDTLVARLSVLYGRVKPLPDTRPLLRAGKDGKFKIVQISDMHMVTGAGVCKDAIDAQGQRLSEREADPLTVNFIGRMLDVEKPSLVILTGDQLHHDIPDTQTALFKAVAPIIERSIPFAAVFGNHDSEGAYALSRNAQMSILQSLPFSLCEPGPEQVDGVGNYHLSILAPAPSQLRLSTLYLLDSHGRAPNRMFSVDYEPIKQSQIDWFVCTSQAQRKFHTVSQSPVSLVFFHIPLPEYGCRQLIIRSGRRIEPTESPKTNSHFYAALAREGVSAVGCGHDHANDFCALLPHQTQQNIDQVSRSGPWLCHAGGSGFGGYGSYGKTFFHRRMRVWELSPGRLNTWLRVEYDDCRVAELMLVANGHST